MTHTPESSSPAPPPKPVPSVNGRTRPWWGPVDAVLAIPWFAVSTLIAATFTGIAIAIGGGDLDGETPVYALFFGVLSFQIMQAAYPCIISRVKGLGIDKDWRFVSSLPKDTLIGFAMAVICFGAAWGVTTSVAQLVGLEDPNEASNTDILVDNTGSPWLIGVIFLVVIGAPLAEELLFRGLLLRIFQKSFGSVFAVVASSLLFALPHWQPDASWRETAVLLSALAVVGAVFAIGAVITDRLGPAVIAHFFFNASSTIAALAL